MFERFFDTPEECLYIDLIREELHALCKMRTKYHLDLFTLYATVVTHHIGRHAFKLVIKSVDRIIGITDTQKVTEFVSSNLLVSS